MSENVVSIQPKKKEIEEDDVVIKSGLYEAVYVGHKAYPWRSGMKLRVLFRIVSDKYHGTVLARHYNIERFKPDISARRRSDLVREIQQVTGKRIARTSRISLSELKRHVMSISVRTVQKTANGEKLHSVNQYSVVGSVLGSVK